MKYFNPKLAESHEKQIAALTDKGLSDDARIVRFAEAAGFDHTELWRALWNNREAGYSPARSVWQIGFCELSLFGALPGCSCPVLENEIAVFQKRPIPFPGICYDVPDNWQPTKQELREFARVQQEARSTEELGVGKSG